MGTPKIRSVLKAFTLIRSFRRSDEWLTSSELSRRARLPEASGYRLVQTLEEIGVIVRDSNGRYGLGMLLLELSRNIAMKDLLRIAPQEVLQFWARKLDMTVQLGVFEEGMVTYVARAGRHRGELMLSSGMQFEAYCTGLGKVLLASLDTNDLDSYFGEGELIRLTPQTITDRDKLCEELEGVRNRGYAIDNCETLDSIRCVAAPVRNPEGEIIAAISFSNSADHLDGTRQNELVNDLHKAAQSVTERLHPWNRVPAPNHPADWRWRNVLAVPALRAGMQ